MINKTLIISAFTSLLLSTTAQAAEPFVLQPVSDNTATPLVKFDDSTHYFVGLTGGSSDISMTAGTVNGNNTTLINQFSSPDVAGFVGADLGFYTAGGSGRIYYSWQKMSTQSDFDGVKAIETDVTLHLLNADYIFRADKTINPFIGAHLGYMTADIKGQGYGFKGEMVHLITMYGHQTSLRIHIGLQLDISTLTLSNSIWVHFHIFTIDNSLEAHFCSEDSYTERIHDEPYF
jgi:hypothetical protein